MQSKKALLILKTLHKKYKHIGTALGYTSPMQLLVAVILSAQCTDQQVNKVTIPLFKKYKTANDFAGIPLKTLEKAIYSTGFYHNKSKHIKATSKKIAKEFNGKVPNTMPDLLSLPGVARKTANIVLSNAFGIIEGIAVDTHVLRLSQRIGLSQNKTSEKIEQDLMQLYPRKEWVNVSDSLIWHGRKTCFARKPACSSCIISKQCISAFKIKGWQ